MFNCKIVIQFIIEVIEVQASLVFVSIKLDIDLAVK